MAETDSSHPTAGRRRRQKGPPAAVQAPLPRLELASDTENEHSDDSAGERERRGRDQNLLLQCRPPADNHMIMMRSWGSREWEPRKLKGLRRT